MEGRVGKPGKRPPEVLELVGCSVDCELTGVSEEELKGVTVVGAAVVCAVVVVETVEVWVIGACEVLGASVVEGNVVVEGVVG